MSVIYVTNMGSQHASGLFCNQNYDFPPGVCVETPLEIAQHIFGYGLDNKEPCLIRLGWVKMNTDLPRALERLSQFRFTKEPMRTDQSLGPLVERVAPPVGRRPRVGAKVQQAA